MNDCRRLNYHKVPVFGRWEWDYNDELPYTQCFEVARQASLLRFTEDQEPNFADLYHNDDVLVSPPLILVPPRRRKRGLEDQNVVEGGKRHENEEKWECSYNDIKEDPNHVVCSPMLSKSKPIDEDLYKIPSNSAPIKPKKKRPIGTIFVKLFAVCMRLISRI